MFDERTREKADASRLADCPEETRRPGNGTNRVRIDFSAQFRCGIRSIIAKQQRRTRNSGRTTSVLDESFTTGPSMGEEKEREYGGGKNPIFPRLSVSDTRAAATVCV